MVPERVRSTLRTRGRAALPQGNLTDAADLSLVDGSAPCAPEGARDVASGAVTGGVGLDRVVEVAGQPR